MSWGQVGLGMWQHGAAWLSFDVGGLGLQYRCTISIPWEVMCLFCSADDGVSIPGEYTSFLAPISSSKLYNEVRACREKDRDPEVKSRSLLSLVPFFFSVSITVFFHWRR